MGKKIALLIAVFTIMANLTSCGASDSNKQSQSESTCSSLSVSSGEMTTAVTENDTERESSTKTLVIYFDYSENIDITGLEADAVSTASLRGGSTGKNIENMKVMVNEIKNLKNADVFSVQVNEVYPPDFEDMTGIAKDDIAHNKQFTFKNEIINLEDYDTVYFGVPVWWGELPQPVHVFFQKYDFSNKTIVPFGIHHGSGFGRMIVQMKEYEPDAVILDGFTINADTDNNDVKSEFDAYLNSL